MKICFQLLIRKVEHELLSHKFHQFHLISETSMDKEIAGESVEKIKVKSPVIAFTFQIYLHRLLDI